MKYYSYIDNLDLTIEDLINLSPYILKEVINELSLSNIEKKTALISGLQDLTLQSYNITIEKNTWLKDLMFRRFDLLKKSSIEVDFKYTNYIGGFKHFLEKYLKPLLTDLVNHLIAENELKLLFQILSQSDLYSDACKAVIIRNLKNKIDTALDILDNSQKNNQINDITYLKSYHFYEIINLYEPQFKNDLIKLYDKITDVFDGFELNTKSPMFPLISQAQIAFQKSQIDDVATKLFIDNNAEKAKQYAYQNQTEETSITTKISRRKISILTIFGSVVFATIVFVSINNKTELSNEELGVSHKEYPDNKQKRITYDNRIRFYYSLKRITDKSKISDTFTEKIIKPFTNPYPKTFNRLTNNLIKSESINVHIANKSDQDLIMFKLIKGKDESLYIPQDKTDFISLNASDSIVFYSGNNFTISKFSRFNELARISDIYKVDEIYSEESTAINITAHDHDPKEHLKQKTISEQNIEITDNIKLRKLSIDVLYRDYYNKYFN